MTALDSKLVYTSDLTTWKFSYFVIIVCVIIFFLLFLQITCITLLLNVSKADYHFATTYYARKNLPKKLRGFIYFD